MASRASSRGRPPARRGTTPPAAQAKRRGVLASAVHLARRQPKSVAAGLALLHLLVAIPALVPVPHPGGDNAAYLALARSLLEGGYRDVFDPARPPHTQFPPGFPLIEAAALALGLEPWVGLKMVTLAFSAAGVALTFLWLRRWRRPGLALGVSLAVALSPGVVQLSHWELSDVPFWALTTAALLAWERARPGRDGRAAAAAALTVAAYLTRSAGIPLLVAVAAWLVWRRRWRHAAILAAFAVPAVAGWWLWGRANPGYASLFLAADAYDPAAGTIGVAGLPGRMGENLWAYLARFLPLLLTGWAGGVGLGLAVAVSALALYGWARRLRRPDAVVLWLPLYAGVLLVWNPAWGGERLLLPLFPALLAFAGDGLARVARAWRVRPLPAGALAAAALVAVGVPGLHAQLRTGMNCTGRWLEGERYACYNAEWSDFMEMARTAGRALPPGAAVISRKPALFWAESGLPGRNYPLAREPDSLFAAASRAGAGYVVLDYVDAVASRYLTPVLMRRPRAFCVMHALGPKRAALLAIRPGADTIPDAGADPGEADRSVAFARCGPELYRSPAVRDSLAGL